MKRHDCSDDICPRCEAAAEDRRDGYDYSEREIDGIAEAEARSMAYGRDPW